MIHNIKKGIFMLAMSTMVLGGVMQGPFLSTMKVEAATVSRIQLNRTKKNLRPGKRFALIPTDSKGTKISTSKFTWSSSDKKIARVSSKGVVTGVKKGRAVITGTLKGSNQKVSCTFTIYNVQNSLELDHANMILTEGDTEKLGVDISRVDETSKDPSWVTFKSLNPSVVTIDASGKVTAKKAGTAVIQADLKKTYKSAVCRVTVNEKPKATTAKKPETTTAKKTTTTTATKSTTETSNTTKPSGKYKTLRVKTTAYCNCSRCCGKWAGGPTASGKMPKEGRTIAVDKNVIPLGTKVEIDGKIYIAEDTGVKGNWIDIYFENHSDTSPYGVQYKTVKIYK